MLKHFTITVFDDNNINKDDNNVESLLGSMTTGMRDVVRDVVK